MSRGPVIAELDPTNCSYNITSASNVVAGRGKTIFQARYEIINSLADGQDLTNNRSVWCMSCSYNKLFSFLSKALRRCWLLGRWRLSQPKYSSQVNSRMINYLCFEKIETLFSSPQDQIHSKSVTIKYSYILIDHKKLPQRSKLPQDLRISKQSSYFFKPCGFS